MTKVTKNLVEHFLLEYFYFGDVKIVSEDLIDITEVGKKVEIGYYRLQKARAAKCAFADDLAILAESEKICNKLKTFFLIQQCLLKKNRYHYALLLCRTSLYS